MLNFKKFYMKKTIFGTKLTYLKIELTQLSLISENQIVIRYKFRTRQIDKFFFPPCDKFYYKNIYL